MAPPSLFTNKSVFMPDPLSTSQTTTKFTDLWTLESSCLGGGFAAINPNGYGVSYISVGEDVIYFHVSSNKKMVEAILMQWRKLRVCWSRGQVSWDTSERAWFTLNSSNRECSR